MLSPLMSPCYALSVSETHGHDSLHAEGWIGEKAYLVTIARLDITMELPKRNLPRQCNLQMASGEGHPILKEAFVKMTLRLHPLTNWVTNWVFVANITDELILRLGVMHAHDTSKDSRCHVL
jgi:hypothetical protein